MLQIIQNLHHHIARQNEQTHVIISKRINYPCFLHLFEWRTISLNSVGYIKSCHSRNWNRNFFLRNGFGQVRLSCILKHQRSFFRSTRLYLLSFYFGNYARQVNFIYVIQLFQRKDGATAMLLQKVNQAFIYVAFQPEFKAVVSDKTEYALFESVGSVIEQKTFLALTDTFSGKVLTAISLTCFRSFTTCSTNIY